MPPGVKSNEKKTPKVGLNFTVVYSSSAQIMVHVPLVVAVLPLVLYRDPGSQ